MQNQGTRAFMSDIWPSGDAAAITAGDLSAGMYLPPACAFQEAQRILAEVEPKWGHIRDIPAFNAVPICWPNWPGSLREDERWALAEALKGFVGGK